MDTRHPDEGTIHAYVESQLPRVEHERVEAHVAECAPCAAAVAEARGLVAAAARIVSALDGVPAGVLPRVARRRTWVPGWLAVAAVGVLAVGISSIALRDGIRMGAVDQGGSDGQREDTTRSAAIAADQGEARPGSSEGIVAPRSARPSPARESVERARTVARRAPEASERLPASGDLRQRDTVTVVSERPALTIAASAAHDPLSPLVLTGHVRSDGRPVEGAVVSLDAQDVRAQTDSAGRYRIELPAGMLIAGATLHARKIGFGARAARLQEVQADRVVDFDLPAAALQLSEAVTTGSRRSEKTLAAPAAIAVSGARSPLRVVKYRATAGTIIELREFPVGESGMPQPPAGFSEFRWRDDARQREFVLTGPFTAAELERLARRLAELEVVP